MAIKGVCVAESGKIGKKLCESCWDFFKGIFCFPSFLKCFCRMTGSVHEEVQVTVGIVTCPVSVIIYLPLRSVFCYCGCFCVQSNCYSHKNIHTVIHPTSIWKVLFQTMFKFHW